MTTRLRMTRLAPSEFAGVAGMFARPYPNLAFVHGVLEQRLPGRVWIEREAGGVPACLVTTMSPYCFVAGDVTATLLDEVVDLLPRDRQVVLVYPPGMTVQAGPLRRPAAPGLRVQFESVADHPEPPVTVLEDGFELVRVDEAGFTELGWREMVRGIFGSAENYVRHHHGFGIRHRGRLVAEAHSVVGGGFAEVGIFTDPAYRRHGLSWIVLSELVRHGLREGLTIVATFDVKAAASRTLAHHLRLQGEREYGVLVLPPA